MARDASVLKLDDLDEIHLLPLGRRARVLPDQRPAIGENPGSIALPQIWCPLEVPLDESTQVVTP